MAHPLTDPETMEREKDSMRVKMEIMIMKVIKMKWIPIYFLSPLMISGSDSSTTIGSTITLTLSDLDPPICNLFSLQAQKEICSALEAEEEPRYKFRVDRWEREEGGGGVTCVIQDGHTFEKAGVNVSVVHGRLPPAAVAQVSSSRSRFFSWEHPRSPPPPRPNLCYNMGGGEKKTVKK